MHTTIHKMPQNTMIILTNHLTELDIPWSCTSATTSGENTGGCYWNLPCVKFATNCTSGHMRRRQCHGGTFVRGGGGLTSVLPSIHQTGIHDPRNPIPGHSCKKWRTHLGFSSGRGDRLLQLFLKVQIGIITAWLVINPLNIVTHFYLSFGCDLTILLILGRVYGG